jgi:translocation and assembly module TamB
LSAATAPGASRGRRRWLRRVLAGGAVAGALAVALVAATLWLLHSTDGQQRLLSWLPSLSGNQIEVTGASGDLRNRFAAQRLRVHTTSADIVIDGLRYELTDYDVRRARFDFRALTADAVTIITRSNGAPVVMPADLKLPFQLRIDALTIGRLRIRAETAAADADGMLFEGIGARVALGGDRHDITLNTATFGELQLRGSANAGAAAPMPLAASVMAQQRDARDGAPPWAANVTASGTLAEITVSGDIKALDQSLIALATVRPFATVPVTTLNASFAALDFSRLSAGLPKTAVTGSAVIAVDQSPMQIDIQADNARPGSLDSGLLPVAELTLRAHGEANSPGQWSISAFALRLFGRQPAGSVTGSGSWKDGPWSLQLAGKDVRLRELQSTLPDISVNGTARAIGTGTDLQRTPVSVNAQLSAIAGADMTRTPPAWRRGFAVDLDATVLASRIELKRLHATAGDSTVQATATAQLQSGANRSWRVDTTAQWSALDPFQWTQLKPDQRATLDGSLIGSATLPERAPQLVQTLSLDAKIDRARWGGQAATASISARLLEPLSAAGARPRIETSGRAQLGSNSATWSGRFGAMTDILTWSFVAPKIEELSAYVETRDRPMRGQLNASGQLDGGWSAPALRGKFDGQDILVSGTVVSRLLGSAQASLSRDAPLEFELVALQVRPDRSAGPTLASNGLANPATPPPEFDLTVQGRGTPQAHRVTAKTSVRNAGRRYTVDAVMSGAVGYDRSGALDAWRGTLERINLDEALAAGTETSQNLLSANAVKLSWLRGVRGQSAVFEVEPGSVTAAGVRISWQRARYTSAPSAAATGRSGRAQLDVDGRVEPFAVAALARRLGNTGVSGDLQLGGQFRVSGEPGESNFVADAMLARTTGDLNAGEADATYALGLQQLSLRLNATSARWQLLLNGEGQRLGRVQAELALATAAGGGLPDGASPLTGTVQARMDDLSVWNSFLPLGWRLGGGVTGSATLAGTPAAPRARGALLLADLSLRNGVEGVDISRGRGRIEFDDRMLRLDGVTAQAGAGRVTVNGEGAIDGSTPLRLAAVFDHFDALARVDRRVQVSGQANLSLGTRALTIDGRLTIDKGLVDIAQIEAPALSEDVVVTRRSDTTRTAPDKPLPRVNMNLTVDLGSDMRLIGRGIETRLAGALTLTTPGGVLTANGNIRTEGGRYDAYGQKLEISRGVLRFVGPPDNPLLDILALRPNRDSDDRVGVAITGIAKQPRIKLYAVPDRNDTDKLAMLVLGRNFDDLGRDETALIQVAALALLSGERAGLGSKLGLDTFSLRQTTGGSTRDVVVAVGKQVSERLYVGYEQGISGTAGTLQLVYRISQRITLRAQTGKDDSSLDAILTFRWR